MRLSLRSCVVPAVLLFFVPACRKNDIPPGPDVKFGQTVHGKVTYKGKAVPYGFVLLFSLEKSLDKKTGLMTPVGVGNITKDGSYELTNAPSGPVVFCVACDPDVQPMELFQPSPLGSGARVKEGEKMPPNASPSGASTGPPGLPSGAQGPPGMPGMPGMHRGGPPQPPMGPQAGPPGGPPRPHIPKIPGLEFNPLAKDLSPEQKKTLKEIHKKYGAFGRSPLSYTVAEGVQTFDLKLE